MFTNMMVTMNYDDSDQLQWWISEKGGNWAVCSSQYTGYDPAAKGLKLAAGVGQSNVNL